jgi:hypothetical protein
VLVLDMIEILPPLGKYKYDTWRILPVKCYIDNSVRLQSCIRNVNTDALPSVNGCHVNEVDPLHEDAPDGDASYPESPRGPGSRPPGDVVPGDVISAPGSSDIVDIRANERGLSGYPKVLPLLASWRQLVGGV